MGNGISTKQAFLFTLINYLGVLIGVVSTILIYPQDKEMLGIIRFVDACAQIMYPIIVLGSTHALINFYPQLTEKLQHKLFSKIGWLGWNFFGCYPILLCRCLV